MNPDAPINKLFAAIPQDMNFGLSLLSMGVKVFVLIGLTFFIIFGVVMVRQITMMSRSVETTLAPFLHLLGYAYLAFAVFVWLFAFSAL